MLQRFGSAVPERGHLRGDVPGRRSVVRVSVRDRFYREFVRNSGEERVRFIAVQQRWKLQAEDPGRL